jgi:protein-S-isoprenylcysteine O-methyltransferase Ste14
LSFQATDFEFRQRLWFIFGIFWLAFLLYPIDHVNVSAALARLIASHVPGAGAHVDAMIRGIFLLGAVVAILAALIRTWAAAYLRSSVVHDISLHSDRLVADGPYRHLRNPLYLGSILLSIAVGTLASRLGFLVLVAGMFIFIMRLILREEATLLRSQGESYRRYYAAVPRLIPSLRPRVPSGGAKPNWADGFSGELFMWGFTAALAVFAVTEKIGYFWVVFAANLLFIFVRESIRRRKRAKTTTAA